MNSRRLIQAYWFDETSLDAVLASYGMVRGERRAEGVVKLLEKSKRDFKKGWSFFTREDIDEKIGKMLKRV